MKKPTDKQRMDWLQNNMSAAYNSKEGCFVIFRSGKSTGYGKTYRAAIDAAMKLQAKGKK